MKSFSFGMFVLVMLGGVFLSHLIPAAQAEESNRYFPFGDTEKFFGEIETLKMEREERENILDRYCRDKTEFEASVLFKFKDATDDEIRASYAFLLGENKVEIAVEDLSKHLTLDLGERIVDRLPLLHRRPVVQALISIGKPSEVSMIKIIETTEDETERELALLVIRAIEGTDITRFILKSRQEKAVDEAVKKRLQKAIDRLAKPIVPE